MHSLAKVADLSRACSRCHIAKLSRLTNVALGGGAGGLNVAVANGGPGAGNGVVGGAAAFVLGLIAWAIGGLALARCRTALELKYGAWRIER